MKSHCENCKLSLQGLWHEQNETLSGIIEVCNKKLSSANIDITNKE